VEVVVGGFFLFISHFFAPQYRSVISMRGGVKRMRGRLLQNSGRLTTIPIVVKREWGDVDIAPYETRTRPIPRASKSGSSHQTSCAHRNSTRAGRPRRQHRQTQIGVRTQIITATAPAKRRSGYSTTAPNNNRGIPKGDSPWARSFGYFSSRKKSNAPQGTAIASL
jgi:hypothetical protein